MEMGIPVVFVILSFAMFVFFYVTKKSGRGSSESLNNYLEAEREANFSRKKEIPEHYFISIDKNMLPVKEYTKEQESDRKYSRVIGIQNDIVKLAGATMIYMQEEMDNRQLKTEFGAGNLERIINCEENYNRFIHGLMEWAAALMSLNDLSSAQRALETAIFYHCDRSQAYTFLADIYKSLNDNQKLAELYKTVGDPEFFPNNPIAREKVFDYVKSLTDET